MFDLSNPDHIKYVTMLLAFLGGFLGSFPLAVWNYWANKQLQAKKHESDTELQKNKHDLDRSLQRDKEQFAACYRAKEDIGSKFLSLHDKMLDVSRTGKLDPETNDRIGELYGEILFQVTRASTYFDEAGVKCFDDAASALINFDTSLRLGLMDNELASKEIRKQDNEQYHVCLRSMIATHDAVKAPLKKELQG